MTEQVWVYVIGPEFATNVKIGIAKNVDKRLSTLQTSNSEPLALHFKVPCESRDEARRIELECHRRLKQHRTVGEWFSVKPEIATEVVDDIRYPDKREKLLEDEKRAKLSRLNAELENLKAIERESNKKMVFHKTQYDHYSEEWRQMFSQVCRLQDEIKKLEVS